MPLLGSHYRAYFHRNCICWEPDENVVLTGLELELLVVRVSEEPSLKQESCH